ncbi:MAG: hypothetical protein KGS72_22350 [Cyanobacteria bacterium REEB67]|nr:hypothetical protein [Cyanobacteria bacterium REEB67]
MIRGQKKKASLVAGFCVCITGLMVKLPIKRLTASSYVGEDEDENICFSRIAFIFPLWGKTFVCQRNYQAFVSLLKQDCSLSGYSSGRMRQSSAKFILWKSMKIKDAKLIVQTIAVIVTLPVVLPVALISLAVTEVGDNLKKCPDCGNRKWTVGHKIAADECPSTVKIRRRGPVYFYVDCTRCHSKFKRLFGGPLIALSEEEIAGIASITFS